MRKFLAFSSLLAITLAACLAGSDTDSIKIGFIGPLTGDAAAYGVDAFHGSQLKVDEINAAGGINRRKIALIAEDGKCTGSDAATAAQKLTNVDKVVAILGGQCSGETLAAAPIVEAAKIVSISALSSSPDITDAGDFIFRDYPSDTLKTRAMAAYFREKGYKKVAIIAENTDFAMGFRNSLKKDFGEDNFVFDEAAEPSTKDYRSLVTRLKSVKFDVFVADGQTPATIVAMVQQMREQGLTQPAITHDAGQTQETLTLGGEAVEGLQAINIPVLAAETPFGASFIAKYGQPQGALAYAAHAYDAMGVLAAAIGSVGTDGTAIRDYLYTLPSYDGAVGQFHFDAKGDVVGISYILVEVQHNAWVELKKIAVE